MSLVHRMAITKRSVPFIPITYDYTTAGSGSVSVPSGATNLIIEVWGAGGGGMGYSDDGFADSQGGGAGGYSKHTITLSSDSGKSISYTVGVGGAIGANSGSGLVGGAGANGGISTCAGATLTNSFSMSGNGGVGGRSTTTYGNYTGGQGGTASGGTTNTTGGSATLLYGAPSSVSGPDGVLGDLSTRAGGGGDGWVYGALTGPLPGETGRVRLRFT